MMLAYSICVYVCVNVGGGDKGYELLNFVYDPSFQVFRKLTAVHKSGIQDDKL